MERNQALRFLFFISCAILLGSGTMYSENEILRVMNTTKYDVTVYGRFDDSSEKTVPKNRNAELPIKEKSALTFIFIKEPLPDIFIFHDYTTTTTPKNNISITVDYTLTATLKEENGMCYVNNVASAGRQY